MGSSQSTPNETDTTQVVLESDDDGEVKISKRHLSREELDNLSAELGQNTVDKNVTIDMELYKSIGADLGFELEEEDEYEDDEYYDDGEVEAYELVEPIETPDNFSMVPGINQMGTVDALELPPLYNTQLAPPPVENTSKESHSTGVEDNLMISNEDSRDTPPSETLSETDNDTELSDSDMSTSYTDSDEELITEQSSDEMSAISQPLPDTVDISLEAEEAEKNPQISDAPVHDLSLESVELSADETEEESELEVSNNEDTEMLADSSCESEVSEVVTTDTVPSDDDPSAVASEHLEALPEETITPEAYSEEVTVTPEAPSEVSKDITVVPAEDSAVIPETLSEYLDVVSEEPTCQVNSDVVEETSDIKLDVPISDVPAETTVEQEQQYSEEPTPQWEPEFPQISTESDIELSDTANIAVSPVEIEPVLETTTPAKTSVQIEPVKDVAAEDVDLNTLEDLEDETTAVKEEAATSEPPTDSSTDNIVQEESTTEPASTPLSAVEAEPQDSIETVEEVEPEATIEHLVGEEIEVVLEPPTISVLPVTEELELISESLSPEEPVTAEPAIPDTVLPGPVAVDHALLEPVVPLSPVEEPNDGVDVTPAGTVVEVEQVLPESVVSVEVEVVPENLPAEDVIPVEQVEQTSEIAEHSLPVTPPPETVEVVSDDVDTVFEPVEFLCEAVESAPVPAESAPLPTESAPVPVETVPVPVETVCEPVKTVCEPVEKEVESVEIATQSVGTSTESLKPATDVLETVPETVTESTSSVSESASGLFGLIQKAIEPYFTAIKEETVLEEPPQLSSQDTTVTPIEDNVPDSEPEPIVPVDATLPERETSTQIEISPTVVETIEPVVEPVVETAAEPVAEPTSAPVEEHAVAEVNVLPKSESLAQSLFGEYKKQEVEKIITEAKVEGARNQARIDADVMSNALNAERSRWRGRFSVIESNLSKRKQDIGSAHEQGFALVTSKLQISETKETCSDSVSEIVDCYLANPDKVLRCNQIAQSFDACVNKALSSR